MDKIVGRLQVFFEDPFWIGIFEKIEGGKLSACKVTFGAEPKDYEIWDFVLRNSYNLKFSPSVATKEKSEIKMNPKRLQREVQKQIENVGLGTKSQQALKLQQEEGKQAHKRKSREQKDAEAERMFELKQQKRKDKHKGH